MGTEDLRRNPWTWGVGSILLLIASFAYVVASWFESRLWAVAIGLAAGSLVLMVLCVRAASSGNRLKAALAIGWAWAFLGLLGLGVLRPTFAGDGIGVDARCLSNVKQQALALLMYASDHDDRFPLGGSWVDSTLPYTQLRFACPASEAPFSYALNLATSSRHNEEGAPPLVSVFEADARLPNASGGREWMVFRHEERGSVALTDGSAKACTRPMATQLSWKPSGEAPQ